MWRALAAVVGLLLAVGIWSAMAGGAPADAPASTAGGSNPSLGFALAAGIIALAATLLVARPRRRFR